MLLGIGRLGVGALIPGDPQPVESIQDTLYGLLCGALGIGVFNANNQLAPRFLGK